MKKVRFIKDEHKEALNIFLVRFFGINGVWMSIFLSIIIKVITAFIFYKREVKYKLLLI